MSAEFLFCKAEEVLLLLWYSTHMLLFPPPFPFFHATVNNEQIYDSQDLWPVPE